MGKRLWLSGVLVCAVVAVAVVLATRGSAGLVGNQNAGTLSGVPVAPDQPADSIGWLSNRSGRTVTLVSASAIPLKGFRTPRLIGVAVRVWNPNSRSLGVTGGAARGWPPTEVAPTVPLRDYRLGSGGGIRHHTALIVFGVVSHTTGRFAVAGVDVTVRVGDELERVRSIGPLLVCVSTRQHTVPCPQRIQNRALRASIAFE